ncbi:MAG TPA: molybdopterin-dependent oxidoreductase, partial [Verrucomicrobiae bacterium]
MTNDPPMPETSGRSVKTVCPYCGVGCGMILQVENSRVAKVIGDKEHPANFGRLCAKGSSVALTLTSSDRLAAAWVRHGKNSERERVPLDLALKETAERLKNIIAQHGPDAVAFYISGQLSMEAQYLAGKLAKGFLRTNNVDSNSRLCMSSAASGYKLSLGADGPPGSYQDIDRLDCALVIGANMADCHPILFLRLLDRQKQGAKIIVVDPRRTATAEKADLYLQIKPGTDLALLNGLLRLLLDNGHTDKNFIAQHTEGWTELRELLKNYSPERVAEITGLPEKDVRTAAKWIGESPEFTTFWTMGLNQSTHGTWHTNAICNLHLATGKICRPGSGPFSLTGQPNAMGGREVGYMSHALPGQRAVTSEEDRAFIERMWGVPAETIRAEPGLDAVSLFQKLENGEVK